MHKCTRHSVTRMTHDHLARSSNPSWDKGLALLPSRVPEGEKGETVVQLQDKLSSSSTRRLGPWASEQFVHMPRKETTLVAPRVMQNVHIRAIYVHVSISSSQYTYATSHTEGWGTQQSQTPPCPCPYLVLLLPHAGGVG